jgi:hypothetical protein
MPRQDAINRLHKVAHRLGEMRVGNGKFANEEIALVGFMVGATYGLKQAAELDYDDARRKPKP